MPWKETNVMYEKTQFINAMLKAEKPFKHICAETGHLREMMLSSINDVMLCINDVTASL